LVTEEPTKQDPTTELRVKVAGDSQGDIVPTFHVTLFPESPNVPLEGAPTTATEVKQEGTLSVTVTP
jgi:hypothetical protein